MKYKLTKETKENMIDEISSYLFHEHQEIISAYVFGSFVTSDSFSDIDLGIITATDMNRPLDFEFEMESQIETISKCRVDVRILNRAPISFSQSVFRNGRVILDRDPNVRADFEGRTLKQYFDFSRFRQRYLQEVTNARI